MPVPAPVPAILRALARLAPGARGTADKLIDLRVETSQAYSPALSDLLVDRSGQPLGELPRPLTLRQHSRLDRLAAADLLHREERLLRVGWTVLSGAGERDLCTPLVYWPVRLQETVGDYQLLVAGDLQITRLVSDRTLADQLAERVATDRPREWIDEVTEAAGLGQIPVGELPSGPIGRRVRGPLTARTGLVVYLADRPEPVNVRDSLRRWAGRGELAQTALAAVYSTACGSGDYGDQDDPGRTVASPLPLSLAQRQVLAAARHQPVTVVSGPPGCGKTHTLAALALDEVARGRSVLLATRSQHAADVIGDMLRRAAGPTPVMFGDTELRRAIANELGEGLPPATPPREVQRRQRALADAVAGQRRVERAAGAALDDEAAALRARSGAELLALHRSTAPALFAGRGEVDVAAVRSAMAEVDRSVRGWFGGLFGRWRRERARRRLAELTGAAAGTPRPDLEAAVAVAEDMATALRVGAGGGTTLGGLRRVLADTDQAVRAAAAAWMDAVTTARDRRSGKSRRAVGTLCNALRAGRATRRRLLEGVQGRELVSALPLWVGTLGDVEDLLPPVPGLFDLVVVDEASHVDQPLAAPALLRAPRCVVSGDPRQLRHVSFVSSADIEAAVVAEDLKPLAGVLDVQRMSLFDVAAAAAPVHWLDEHHRCAPHLIGFAADQFYTERMALLTTHPRIADTDCIDVELVAGQRDKDGVNAVEVTAAVGRVRGLVDAGITSIGLLSPFRAQADALEKAVLDGFTVRQIDKAGLRAGTVHAFQGSECDVLVISLALAGEDSWRFVNDPNLLAVLTTRARTFVHLITSVERPPGLAGDYVRHAGEPPRETEGVPAGDPWTAAVAGALADAGVPVRTGYPVGRWRVDLAVGDGPSAVALETAPHPDGLTAHLARWRTLAAAGWTVRDAYPTRFDHDPVRAAVQLAGEFLTCT